MCAFLSSDGFASDKGMEIRMLTGRDKFPRIRASFQWRMLVVIPVLFVTSLAAESHASIIAQGSRICDTDRVAVAAKDESYTLTDKNQVVVFAGGVNGNDSKLENESPHVWRFRRVGGSWANITTTSEVKLTDSNALVNGSPLSSANRRATEGDPQTYVVAGREFESSSSQNIANGVQSGQITEAQVALSFADALDGQEYEFACEWDNDQSPLVIVYAATITVPKTYAAPIVQDSWLKESAPAENHGGDSQLNSKKVILDDMRPVFQFDLSSIPANEAVVSATAEFYVTAVDASSMPVEIYRVTDAWTELSVTWTNTSADYDDTTVHGSLIPNVNAVISVDVTGLVQGWVSGTYANNGMMFLSTSDNMESKFASREWATSSQRPKLTVVTVDAAIQSDLGVVKTVTDETPDEGQSLTYTITLTNLGPDPATGITVDDLLPAGVTYVSDVATQGSYVDGSGTWTVGALASAASVSLDITATVNAGTAGTTIDNTAAVSALDQIDPFGGNDNDSIGITVNAYSISGRVFEDADFSGTASEWDGGAVDVGLDNVDVELYDGLNTYVASVTTAGGGAYLFTGLSNDSYRVRVRSSTIGDVDTPPRGTLNPTVPASWPYPLAEMTWGNGSALYGGQDPTIDDTATEDNLGPGDTYVSVTVSGASISGVNMGFAYNLIVNTEDDGAADAARSDQGSLRQFLKNANAIGTAGGTTANSSQFRIPGASPHIIQPTAALPSISDPITIDGYTQPGSTPNTNPAPGPLNGTLAIVVDGSLLGSNVDGLVFGAAGSTIRGLVVHSFTRTGVRIDGANATLAGNYIGTDETGSLARANSRYAVDQRGANVQIGGPSPADRNLISGNGDHGVNFWAVAASDGLVQGNLIGTNAAGTSDIPNLDGIHVDGGARKITIVDNVISGNGEDGVMMASTCDSTVVQGNYIGLNAAGTGAIPNGRYGIVLYNGPFDNQIGGSGAGEANVISGNGNSGIAIDGNSGVSTTNNTIQGNFIGTNAAGNAPVPNVLDGVRLFLGSRNNRIGGSAIGEGNTIAFNGADGIAVRDASTDNHEIFGNSIFSNTGLGIDLDPDGLGVGSGANNDMAAPTITSVTANGANFDVTLTTGSGNTVELFRVTNGASPVVTADPTGSGEGFFFLGRCVDNGAITGPHIVAGADGDPTGGTVLVTVLASGLSGGDDVTATATGAGDGTSEFAANHQAPASLSSISGTVFEDIVGDVLDDGAIGDVNNPGAVGVDVYLYLDDGDANLDAGDTLIGGVPTQTDVSGGYSFTGLADGDYFVVVDSKTVGSSQDPLAVQADIWAEQTYGPVGAYYDNGIGYGIRVSPGPCYGGIAGHLSDDFSQWDDREHRAALTVSGGDIANVDFGFSFNVVTNLAAGGAQDNDAIANRTVQGSLRQFIQNANAIDAPSVMRFVPAESPGAGDGLGNLWWRLMVTEVLPVLTSDGTTIDGRAFDFIDGTTILNPNAARTGAGVSVGTEGTYTTPQLDPELEIRNLRSTAVIPTGLVFEANNSVLRHVSIWGFGDSAGTFDANVRFGTNFGVDPDFTGSIVEFNVIGAGPASFTEPAVSDRSGQKNLTMRETDGAIVRDNLIGFAGGVGVDFNSSATSGVVLRNEIRRNGILDPIGNPVGVWLSGQVTGNLVTDNASGIYSAPTPGVSYQDNTITANGWGGTRPDGIRASGSSASIQRNVIANNAGAAVVVQSTTTDVQVSRNSTYGNGTSGGQLGIDLLASGDDPIGGPFVTINDSLDLDTGGNDLLNFPVLDSAAIQGSDLVLTGWARPGSQIEFYLANSDPLGFGEGETWLITRTEGSGDDTDATTGSYGPGAINGFVQGSDNTNLFSFTVPLASMAAPVGTNDEITALAYLGGNTSEFSANVVVSAANVAPEARDDPGGYASLLSSFVPVGWWRLGEGFGTTAIDLGTAGNDATYASAFLGEAGGLVADIDTAMRLDGTGHVEIPHVPEYLIDEGAVQFWFRVASWPSTMGGLFSKDSTGLDTGGHLDVKLLSNGRVEARLQAVASEATITSATPVSVDDWHHVLVAFGSAGFRLYVDGALEGSDPFGSGLGTSSGGAGNLEPIALGGSTYESDNFLISPLVEPFTGWMDDVAILAGSFTETDARNLYFTGADQYQTTTGNPLLVAADRGVLRNDTDPEGSSLTTSLVTGPSNAASFSLSPDGGFSYTANGGFIGTDSFVYEAADTGGESSQATVSIEVTAAVFVVAGTVFEDVDFSGTAGGYDGGALDQPLANVDVELYDAADAFVATTATAGDGTYTFTGLTEGNYKVRVRSASVGDADTPPAGGLNPTVPADYPYPVPEMTWGNGVPAYGGQDPTVDDADTTDDGGPGDTHVAVNVSGGDLLNVNIGFAYNLIVNVDDDGAADNVRSAQGSLRQFLKNANAIGVANGTTANSSVFRMQVPANQTAGADSWWRIAPLSRLTEIRDDGTVLDATTQTLLGGDSNSLGPEIELSGSLAGNVNGISLISANDTVRGFIINGWDTFVQSAIYIWGAAALGYVVEGNYLGTDHAGMVAVPNTYGIRVLGGGGGTIGGTDPEDRNLISGNAEFGIILSSAATGNVVLGNYIGTDRNGTGPLTNGQSGIQIEAGAHTNTIGGTSTAERNIISGNAQSGVVITGATSSNNVIRGNFIGVDANGNDALANGQHGVQILGGSTNMVGGSLPDAGNVISGNASMGVSLEGVDVTGTIIQGNLIGLGIDGSTPAPNSWGIGAGAGATGSTIGGNSPATRNVLSGNTNDGVNLNGSGVDNHTIIGNYIGTDSSGATGVPNNNGVYIMGGAAGNSVGGPLSTDANLIAFNNYSGVSVVDASLDNAVLGNRLHNNASLGLVGIDLESDGLTANDGAKNASESNNGMDHPVITGAALSGTTLTLSGYVGNGPDQSLFANARVEFFESLPDGSGHGQGISFLDFLTTDANGNFSGDIDVAGKGIVVGDEVTATATDPDGNTSEYAQDAAVLLGPGSGLTGHWTFDADASDSSGNGFHGILTADASIDTDAGSNRVGSGKLSLDGTGDFVDLASHAGSFATLAEGTVYGWVNFTGTAEGTILDLSDGAGGKYATFFVQNGLLGWNLNAGGTMHVSVQSTAAIHDGNWHQVVVTTDSGGNHLYVDGAELTGGEIAYSSGGPTTTEFFTALGGASWMSIGGYMSGSITGEFAGFLDDVRVYDRALSGTEISDLFDATLPTYDVSGRVFEDADFSGTASAYDGGVVDLALANVDVELYDADATDTFVSSTTTDPSGAYVFTGLAEGNYKVRVRSASVGDADTPPAGGLNPTVPASYPYPVPEMTWGNGVAALGGQDPTVDDADAADDGGPGDTYVAVNISGGDLLNVNIGFAYNLIVHTADDGAADSARSQQGSLRQFIKNANAIAGVQVSRFGLLVADPGYDPVGGYWSIEPATRELPSISDPIVLDGYTQVGASAGSTGYPNPFDAVLKVQLDGSSLADASGLRLAAGGSTIRGLAVGGFTGAGAHGIEVAGSGSSTIEGNFIGTDVTGTVPFGNSGYTVYLNSPNNLLGGDAPGAGNVLSSGGSYGIWIAGAGNRIEGNLVGTDSSGSSGLGHVASGIGVATGRNIRIGGTTPGSGNLISGNNGNGIWFNSSPDSVTVEGNRIGTDLSGTVPLPNGGSGVHVNSPNTFVGGTSAGSGNLISGNINGITISSLATNTVVQGNHIGTQLGGTGSAPNTGTGILISTTGNMIGGPTPEASNVIANSGSDNIRVGAAATGVSILGNSIFGSGDLIDQIGIDLGADGVTPNDPGDADSGPNEQRNFPVVTAAFESGGEVTVDFDLDLGSALAGDYRVEFFRNPSGGDDTHGEGEVFTSAVNISHTGSGLESFSHAFPASVGDLLTATVTDSLAAGGYGSTSEFSESVTVLAIPTSADLQLQKSVDIALPNESDTIVYTLALTNNGPDPGSGIEVADLLPAGVTYISDTPSQGSYVSGTGIWAVGNLATAASATLDIRATVDPGTMGSAIDNTASVSALEQTDPTSGNDSDMASITVNGGTVRVSVAFSEGRVLRPGATGEEILRLHIVNPTFAPASLSAMSIVNTSLGIGTQAEMDASWGTIQILLDDGTTLRAPPSSGPGAVTETIFANGRSSFSGLAIEIAAGDSLDVVVQGEVALTARDSDRLGVNLLDETDLVWSTPSEVAVDLSPDTEPMFVVDGMVADQVGVSPVPAGILVIGSRQNLALDVTLPPNGYTSDELDRLNVTQLGDAPVADLERVEAWVDDGDGVFDSAMDDRLGAMTFSGNRWELTGIARPVPTSGLRVFISVDVHADAVDGRTVQLALPASVDVGVGMVSGNDGPLDRPVQNPFALAISSSDRVIVAATSIAPGVVNPGDRDVLLIRLSATNAYPVARTLRRLRVANVSASSGTATVAQLDGQFDQLQLRLDGNDNGVLDDLLTDPILSASTFQAGHAEFDGLNWDLQSGATRTLFIAAGISITGASDADVLAATISTSADLEFDGVTALAGSFPLDSQARWTVDGLVSAQVARGGIQPLTLASGEGPALVLDLTIPNNGYASDVLEGLQIVNLGTATASDLADVRLWRDGGDGAFDAGSGDDTEVGPLVSVGSSWSSPLLGESLGVAGARLYVGVTAALVPTDSTTIQMAVPIAGITVGSGNDGPIDLRIESPTTLLLSTAPLVATLESHPEASVVGQTVDVHLHVRNVGTEAVNGITPSALEMMGVGSLSMLNGPTPSSLDLAGSASGTFTWSYRADGVGRVQMSGSAAGVGALGGQPRNSLQATSNEHRIHESAVELELFPVANMPFTINRGQTGVVPLTLTFRNAGGNDVAPVRLDRLRIALEDESGSGVVPADLLSRIVVNEGEDVYLERSTLEATGNEIDLVLSQPVIVTGQEPVTLGLRLDISPTTTVPSFRVSVSAATWFEAIDLVAGTSVPVMLQSGNYPILSGLGRLAEQASQLDIASADSGERRAGPGQPSVSLMTLDLRNPGSAGLSADIQVSSFAVSVEDTLGRSVSDLSTLLGRIRVQNDAQVVSEVVVEPGDDFVVFSLSPPIIVPVNAPVEIDVYAMLVEGIVPGAFRMRLRSANEVDARDGNTRSPVAVLLDRTPLRGPIVVVEAEATELIAFGTPGFPSTLTIGTPGVTALTATVRHPGAAGTAAIRVNELSILCRDEEQSPLAPGDYLDAIRIYWNGIEVGSETNPPGAEVPVSLVLSGLEISPGEIGQIGILVDIEATAPATGLELIVGSTDLVAIDSNLGSAVELRPPPGRIFPLSSALTQLAPPSDLLVVSLVDQMPAALAVGPGELSVASIRLANPAESGVGPVAVDQLQLRAADRDFVDQPVGSTVTELRAYRGTELWATTGPLPSGTAVATLLPPAPLLVEPGAEEQVEIRVFFRPSSNVETLRLGLDADGVRVIQPQGAILTIRVEPAPGLVFPMWTEAGSFSGLTLDDSYSNFPNPFAAGREQTTFVYSLDGPATVTLRVYTARGEVVRTLRDRVHRAGGLYQDDAWDGRNGRGGVVVNGVYVAELVIDFDDGESHRVRRKVAVLR